MSGGDTVHFPTHYSRRVSFYHCHNSLRAHKIFGKICSRTATCRFETSRGLWGSMGLPIDLTKVGELGVFMPDSNEKMGYA